VRAASSWEGTPAIASGLEGAAGTSGEETSPLGGGALREIGAGLAGGAACSTVTVEATAAASGEVAGAWLQAVEIARPVRAAAAAMRISGPFGCAPRVALGLGAVGILDLDELGGDGNGDGILDSRQTNVTSLRDVSTGHYLTVALNIPRGRGAGGCDQINSVFSFLEETFGDDPLYVYPAGITQIDVSCASAEIVIYYHDLGFTPDAYRNFGPTVPGDFSTATWYDAPGVVFGRADVGGNSVVTAGFILVDGALGDDTDVDQRIISRGGITRFAPPIPTLSIWASALMGLLLTGLAGIGYRCRRIQKRGRS